MDMDEIGYFIFMEEQEQKPQEAEKPKQQEDELKRGALRSPL